MNISQVASTEHRLKILCHVIFQVSPFYVNDIARKTGISKGLVSKYLNLLLDNNILNEDGRGFRVKDSTETKSLRIMLSLNNLELGFLPKYPFIKGAGVYGSVVKGQNTLESDIDLWVFHEKATPERLAKVSKELALQGGINTLYLTEANIKKMKEEDPVFYYSLFFGSITLYGEAFDSI